MEKLRIAGWNPKIQGLRGFSIVLVFVGHLSGNNAHNWGPLGVAIFFVISGYVITESIARQVLNQNQEHISLLSFLQLFYLRRARRLLPLAFLVIISTFLISLYDPNADKKQYLLSAVFCLLYIGNLFGFTFGYTDLAPALSHFWSLAVEEQFYFIWPIVFFVAIKKFNKKSKLIYILMAVIAVIGMSHPLISLANKTVWTLPTTYFDLLLLGCLFNLIGSEIEKLCGFKLIMMQLAGLLSLALIILGSRISNFGLLSHFQYNANFILAGLLFVFALRSRFFDNRFLRYFGEVSYSLYCIHWPLIFFCRTYIGDHLLTMIFAAGVSIALSALSHKYFESRFYNSQIKPKTTHKFI